MKFDYIIVGQGLAGTLLSYRLYKRGYKIAVIDQGLDKSCTTKMGGVINPITGRKYVKSWMIDSLLPEAMVIYEEMEDFLKINFIHKKNIIRLFTTIQEENAWLARSADPEYENYINKCPGPIEDSMYIHKPLAYGEIINSAVIEIPKMAQAYRDFLKSNKFLLDGIFDISKLEISSEGYKYENLEAEKIVFCEGYKIITNKYFNFLPMNLAKGEALIVKFTNAKFNNIIKKKISIEPLSDGTCWVGSNYIWEFDDSNSDPQYEKYLTSHLQDITPEDYKIIRQMAGIRPTVIDRRPLLGSHPDYKGMYVFNGLGTKGVSLAPYFSKIMIQYLLDEEPIPEEVDIKRFREII